ncbi:hypothetical protein Glove_30g41 [Diversispora epigaea]|uniref:Uncharacterized protein n=1 Tax=Diversispora epigaea TaxID=1348612 RepID=A0A397JJJ9_9GLOM|nr:hypothetical protein Glove_30g41 [Diversispora epigaea]
MRYHSALLIGHKNLDNAVGIAPNNSYALKSRGEVYSKFQRHDDALGDIKDTLKIKSTNVKLIRIILDNAYDNIRNSKEEILNDIRKRNVQILEVSTSFSNIKCDKCDITTSVIVCLKKIGWNQLRERIQIQREYYKILDDKITINNPI